MSITDPVLDPKLRQTPVEEFIVPDLSGALLVQRQRSLLRELEQLAAERANAETDLAQEFRARNESAEARLENLLHKLEHDATARRAALDQERARIRHEATACHEEERRAAERALAEVRARSAKEYGAGREALEAEFQESRWTAAAVLEAARTTADRLLEDVRKEITLQRDKVAELRHKARPVLGGPSQPPAEPGDLSDEDPAAALRAATADADACWEDLNRSVVLKMLRPRVFAVGLVVVWALALLPGAWQPGWFWPTAGTAGTLAAGIVVYAGLSLAARPRLRAARDRLFRALDRADDLCRLCDEQADRHYEEQRARDQTGHDDAVEQAENKYRRRLKEITVRRRDDLREAEAACRQRLADSTRRRDAELARAEGEYSRRRAELEDRYQRETEQIHARYHRRLNDSRTAHEDDWNVLAQNWQQGLAQVQDGAGEIAQETRALFPHWSHESWADWQLPRALPPVVRFGELLVDLAQISHGVPADKRLRTMGPPGFVFPALLSFPDRSSLLIKAGEEGRAEAEEALQALIFRLLTGVPPGKVRFTIIDPVGLGQGFAAFMHLADHDETLVSDRIWTEPAQIEQRLADLTAHMETVIQKYLRNQYATITEYNAHAGEVAEPFRFLVVANFPAGFTPEAARRLASIVESGPRCGVHVLITVDTRLPLPPNFQIKDLERSAARLVWQDGRFVWNDRDFGRFHLRTETPPPADFATRILRQVGERAREAGRVEVPFEFVAPPPGEWWTADSRHGLRVPLGRAGATKRQVLALGQGTAQHVLVAGKTGSGKSTLLHALVTNVALLYRPDEVELYLVDFKEGVEFKAYATHELPHARLVAIESEREFGLSVLQRLEAELKQRGDRFRATGVQDLAGFRQATGGKLPRILLVVDEFQMFFIEDDRVAQEAALLLDRLVRQGRAFGIHVLLGSQTLGGAYSLARSTLGQMAVRIALQCSEADAHLILSDDNPAARLLSRPGEAIYNDANGLAEGNDFFQVVWLPDHQRDDYLRRVGALARQRRFAPPQPQIVFEGKAPAEIAKNYLLEKLLAAPDWPAGRRVPAAWLGEALAIKDPTAATFRPQTGSNLLIVGQSNEPALAVTAASLISLAAQHPPAGTGSAEEIQERRGVSPPVQQVANDSRPESVPRLCQPCEAPPTAGPVPDPSSTPEKPPSTAVSAVARQKDVAGARFYILDGIPAEDPHAGYLGQLAELLPHPVRVAAWRDLPAVLAELAAETERRHRSPEAQGPTLYLLVHGLHRFRELRRPEDDFGFGRADDGPPPPPRWFATILREGPAVGVHVLAWCDSLTNVQRVLDRQGLREFDMRVLFQMGAADSSALIDSPLASRLGLHRALFYREDRAQPEKFRPYGLPSEAWLASVQDRMTARAKSLPR